MKDYYKLDKFLFEDKKYRNLKLNSKTSYCILKDMLNENKYIDNARNYLMQKLDITKNTKQLFIKN